MYYIDTPTLRVDTYPYTPSSGELGPRGTPAAVFPADMSFGYPDGMALDADGNIWVACFNVSGVCVFVGVAAVAAVAALGCPAPPPSFPKRLGGLPLLPW